MKKLLWCCQHAISAEQRKDLSDFQISFLSEENPVLFKSLSNCPASSIALQDLAFQLSLECTKFDIAIMPIGSPAFQFIFAYKVCEMNIGDKELAVGIWFAYSERDSYDEVQEDGSTKKVSIFKHIGWIKL